jgi:hypothetical protein
MEKYSVGFKSDGKITALHLDLGINAGNITGRESIYATCYS